jgi:hypothetical protein
VLGVAACAILTRARSLVAIAEWAADLPGDIAAQLRVAARVPSESTVRRALRDVDTDTTPGWELDRCADPRPGRPTRGRGGGRERVADLVRCTFQPFNTLSSDWPAKASG